MTPPTIERLNPESLPDAGAMGYSQITKSRPGTLAFISGQVAWTRDGKPVPQELGAQAELAVRNLGAALEAAGAAPANVTSLRIYVVAMDPERQGQVIPPLAELFGEHAPAVTAVGVTSLAAPDLLVEIEAIAVI
ncbi:MAG: RidA family protein [Myxococcota bacterium]|nr:RidA family protein [Myxococcota bacterium]